MQHLARSYADESIEFIVEQYIQTIADIPAVYCSNSITADALPLPR